MAAEVKYRITATDESKGATDSAAKNTENLERTTQSSTESISKSWLKATAAIAGVAIAVKKIIDVGTELVDKWRIQEDALAGLSAAIRATGHETDISVAHLDKFASALQKTTTYGNEVTDSAIAILQQLANLNQNGLEQIIPRIQDMASAMHLDLFTAASLVGKTLGSTTNALSRYGIVIDATAPKTEKLAQLTDAMNKMFGGTAEAMANTSSGAAKQLNNAIGDLQETFGRLIEKGLKPAQQELADVVTQANEAISKLITLNEIRSQGTGAITMDEAKAIYDQHLQDLETQQSFNSLYKQYLDLEKQLGNINALGIVMDNEANGLHMTDLNTLRQYVLKLQERIKLQAQARADAEQFKKLAETIYGIEDSLRSPLQKQLDTINEQIGQLRVYLSYSDLSDKHRLDAQTALNTLLERQKSLQEQIAGTTEKTAAAIDRITRGNAASQIAHQLAGQENVGGLTSSAGVTGGSVSSGGGLPAGLTQIFNSLGQQLGGFAGKLVQAAASMDPIQIALTALEPLFFALANKIAPALNKILEPIVNILSVMGEMIAAELMPILNALAPIMELVGKAFVWFYNNILRHVANAFIAVSNMLAWAIGGVVNMIIDIVNFLSSWATGKTIKHVATPNSPSEGFLSAITYGQFASAGNDYMNAGGAAGGTTGAGASYSQARAITINLYIQDNKIYGGGGEQQFVLDIVNEMKQLSVLGIT